MAKGVVGILVGLLLLGLAWWLLCGPAREPVANEAPLAEPAPAPAAAPGPAETFQELADRSPDLAVRETESATVVELSDLLFDFDRAEIRRSGEPVLEALVTYLQEDPRRRVRINGHADAIGDVEYNRQLSERRAEVVRRFLVAQGVAPGRLTVRAFGESLPAASNETARGRQLNRRVELTIDRPPAAAE
jgi:outer membrane protein OmpA-like peptidoglycan-associated protein